MIYKKIQLNIIRLDFFSFIRRLAYVAPGCRSPPHKKRASENKQKNTEEKNDEEKKHRK